MADTVAHRGPDDAGVWCDMEHGVALAHRRLSIVDLSPLGHQPMASPKGRYRITLNGEIYNHRDLRRDLQSSGHTFRGNSDTEVLLAAIDEWGVVGAASRAVGMFAFAVWDTRDAVLHLVRDRIGEKPLYYGVLGDAFVFGSELKAMQAHPGWRGDIDRDALALFFRYNYVPAPHSIFEGVRKLTPGTVLTVRGEDLSFGNPVPYWSAHGAIAQSLANPFEGSIGEAASELEALLGTTIDQQMMADVPIGALLSGGIDSSTIVAIMQSRSSRPIRTFTIGFEETQFDEARQAKAVAAHLGTDHTEAYIAPQAARDIIVDLPNIYDEPFADSSQIPTHLVSRIARQHVTVALTGDGGDELFAGYNRYTFGPRLWNSSRHLPRPLRLALAHTLEHVPPAAWRAVLAVLSPFVPAGAQMVRFEEKAGKIASVLRAKHERDVFDQLVSIWTAPPVAQPSLLTDTSAWPTGISPSDFAGRMMFADVLAYLPDDVLTKVDRAAMRVGLETRVPFLDHRIVEFAWRVPTSTHLRGSSGKRVLRHLLCRYVPSELVERPKMGFGVPIGRWLRHELRSWAEGLLDPRRIREDGFVDAELVRAAWDDHVVGRRDRSAQLWGVLMFQSWLDASSCRARAGNRAR